MRRLLSRGIPAIVVGAGALLPAQQAHAAQLDLTIHSGNWHCSQGRNVTSVLIDVVPSLSGQPGWINGTERTVTVNFREGQIATISVVSFCRTAWYGAGYYRTSFINIPLKENMRTDWYV